MIGYWGKSKEVIGLTLEKAVPELKGPPFLGLLKQVWRTGISYEARDTAAQLLVDGKLQTFYFDFAYRAVKDRYGAMDCILHTAVDVSERVANRRLLESAAAQKIALHAQQALNEQLALSNEDLRLAQTALETLNQELETRVCSRTKALTESESRLRGLITHAPVAIAIFKGRDLIIESANAKILKLWGKKHDIVGQRLAHAMPELKGQPFLEILDKVFTTGQPYYSDESPALLEHNGVLQTYFFSFYTSRS